jgi:Xaa-Pro aminopeptidase
LGLAHFFNSLLSVKENPDPMLGFSPDVFATRRERVLADLDGSALVLTSETNASGARYRADSDLFYLTGVTEPGAVVVLRTGSDDGDYVLFVRPRSPEDERWTGERLGPERAGEVFGADTTHGNDLLSEHLPKLLAEVEEVYFRIGTESPVRDLVLAALQTARTRGARKGVGPRGIIDPGRLLDPLRLIKNPEELERMRRAASITIAAFTEMFGTVRPGVGEWELEGVLEGAFRRKGASGPAYPTIVGSGANACVLHYDDNDCTVGDGDLVLVDAGAEVNHYVCDITRTFPASGAFTAVQRAIYDLVLEAHDRAIDGIGPGASVESIHNTARDVLVDGLLELGVLEGARADVLDTETYKPFFPHQTSHWLGLDVHDVGDYASSGVSRVLEPGMVLTVEPGLYFPGPFEDSRVAEEYLGIGVRIEDDVVVTEDGHEVLTAGLPVAAEEIESLVGGGE